MPRLSVRVPKYRLHKPSGQSVVTLDGKDFYLGEYGSPESKSEYNRLVAEWQLAGRSIPNHSSRNARSRTIDELIAAYMKHVQEYYVKDGQPTSSQSEARRSLMFLHEQYGSVSPEDFGPLALKSARSRAKPNGSATNSHGPRLTLPASLPNTRATIQERVIRFSSPWRISMTHRSLWSLSHA